MKKKFIIIGSKSAISYKEFFPLFKEGNCFVGYNSGNGTMYFKTAHTNDKLRSVPSYWYTNFDLNKVHKPLVLTKEYKGNELLYPIADNYNYPLKPDFLLKSLGIYDIINNI